MLDVPPDQIEHAANMAIDMLARDLWQVSPVVLLAEVTSNTRDGAGLVTS
jgi:hypothetical protein